VEGWAMTLILPSTVVLFLYETFQVFISKGIPSRRDEQPFNLIRRIFREGGHTTIFTHRLVLRNFSEGGSFSAGGQPFSPQRGRHSFFPTGFL